MNDTEIAKAKRDFELKKAAYDVEVQTKVFLQDDIFHLFSYFPLESWGRTCLWAAGCKNKTEDQGGKYAD